tara:strand:+ start:1248 stop:1460 length:213 start_codon:yes stop_codon:yes gene_type:complete
MYNKQKQIDNLTEEIKKSEKDLESLKMKIFNLVIERDGLLLKKYCYENEVKQSQEPDTKKRKAISIALVN